MIRRPPRSTLDRSSAASDVYKRQAMHGAHPIAMNDLRVVVQVEDLITSCLREPIVHPVSYTHLRAHETVLDIVCRLLLEKKKHKHLKDVLTVTHKQISVTTG